LPSVIFTATSYAIVTSICNISFYCSKGIGVISWEFISEMPKNGMTEGGFFPAIVGTLWFSKYDICVSCRCS
jgi:phosphate transport system permease protein